MKKIITLLLAILMVFTLTGCGPKSMEEKPVEVEPAHVVVSASETVLGGWIDAKDGTITDELRDLFNKALEGLLGATYEPVKLLATQVVNGTNYKFLANGTKTTNPITVGTYNVTINKSSDGTITLVDIETIEEKQEEGTDTSKLSFWVVFYDQYGVEVQRTVEKYGTVPSFKGELPLGFEKWAYKKTQKEVDKFKPITSNTYFEAICHSVNGSLPPVNYLAWNGSELVERVTTDYRVINNNTTTLGSGFYIVDGSDVQTSSLTVSGTSSDPTYIILCNGAKLTTTSVVADKAGIDVEENKGLIITTPASGNGILNVQGGENAAGIGSNFGTDNSCGDITINGGAVTSTGGQNGAGVGCGASGNKGTININGGNINATGGRGAAGIGGGAKSQTNSGGVGVTINIRGGEVNATGSNGYTSLSGSAGIGSGEYGNSGLITITGGTITATGKRGGAGIGAGSLGYCGDITISGGTVTATGGNENKEGGAGIGGGYLRGTGTITLNGGTITAEGRGGAGIGAGNSYTYVTDGSSNKINGGFKIIINGGTISASSTGGSGIGAGGDTSSPENNTCSKEITINGGTIYAEAKGTPGSAIGPCKVAETITLQFDTTKSFIILAGVGRESITVQEYLNQNLTLLKVEITTN